MNREEYLLEVIKRLDLPGVPPGVKVSIGFPSRGSSLRSKAGLLGECFGVSNSTTSPQIFLNPRIKVDDDGPTGYLGVLAHELAHAASTDLPRNNPHSGDFVRICKEWGLEAKRGPTGRPQWKYAAPGKELLAILQAIQAKLGSLPHETLPDTARKVQSTRLKLIECSCGRKLRASLKVVDEGPIICGLCDKPFKHTESEE